MLVEFDVERIGGRAGIAGPEFFLGEAHAIEHLLGLASAAVGQFLGIAELSTNPLDHARLAADVVGRADMPRRIAFADMHRGADVEARRHGLPALGPSGRFSMSASLARTSSMLIVPRWIRACEIELIQRS